VDRRQVIVRSFLAWLEGLPKEGHARRPATGSVGAAMVVLDRQIESCQIEDEPNLSERGAQVKGVSGPALKKVLAKFGEHRIYSREGGRTNRGAPAAVRAMLKVLRDTGFAELADEERKEVATALQHILLEEVRAYFNRQILGITFDPTRSVWSNIAHMLQRAQEVKKSGPVAQHLVGAKLALRFPERSAEIGLDSYSTADDQTGRPGDFAFGDTAFHVTVHPLPGVFDRCLHNLQHGYRPYLLVTHAWLTDSRQRADAVAEGRIAVESIESFVSQNIEELSEFDLDGVKSGLRALLEEYNRRVDAAETDRSLMVEIPGNL